MRQRRQNRMQVRWGFLGSDLSGSRNILKNNLKGSRKTEQEGKNARIAKCHEGHPDLGCPPAQGSSHTPESLQSWGKVAGLLGNLYSQTHQSEVKRPFMGGGGEDGNFRPPALLCAGRGIRAARGQSSDKSQRCWLWAVKAHGGLCAPRQWKESKMTWAEPRQPLRHSWRLADISSCPPTGKWAEREITERPGSWQF